MSDRQEPISEADLARRKPKRKIGCVTLGLIAFLSVVAFALLVLFFWNMAASKRLNENLARLKQAGYATNYEELQAAIEATSGDNAGPLFVSAGDSLVRQHDMSLPFIGEGQNPPPPGSDWAQLDAAKAYLSKVSKDVASLHQQAQSTKPARYYTNFDETAGLYEALPYKDSHRQACRVLTLAAYVHAHEGRNSEVLKCIHTGLRIAGSLRDEPSLVGQQLSMACVHYSRSMVADFIGLDYADSELANLQVAIHSLDPKASLAIALEAEMVTVLENFRNPRLIGPLPRKQDAAFFVEITQPLLEAAANDPWPDILKGAADAKHKADDLAKNPTEAARYMLALNIIPSLEATVRAHTRAAAELVVADAIIASKRFHMKQGRLPITIDELVPEFLPAAPVDPFSKDAKPLQLNTANGRTKIYSLGFNQVDDQGLGESGGASVGPLDIVMELHPRE